MVANAENNDPTPKPKKGRKVTHELPRMLQDGPVILFGFQRPPGPFPGAVNTGPSGPTQPNSDQAAEGHPAEPVAAKDAIQIVESTRPMAIAILQTGRPLPPEGETEKR